MATEAYPSAGTKLYVSATTPATEDQAGYDALDWTEVSEVTDIPECGKAYNIINFNPLADRKTYKFKSSYNNGSITLAMGRDPDDEGQAILVEALDSDDDIAFKAVRNDDEAQCFSGVVASYTSNIGTVENVHMAAALVEINNDIVEYTETETS